MSENRTENTREFFKRHQQTISRKYARPMPFALSARPVPLKPNQLVLPSDDGKRKQLSEHVDISANNVYISKQGMKNPHNQRFLEVLRLLRASGQPVSANLATELYQNPDMLVSLREQLLTNPQQQLPPAFNANSFKV